MQTEGTLKVHTENIFPIIKKFLYSDHEIFLRELVSNAVDACQKVKTLSVSGEIKNDGNGLRVEVIADKNAKTLTVRDNGVGMTAEEVEKYINQIGQYGKLLIAMGFEINKKIIIYLQEENCISTNCHKQQTFLKHNAFSMFGKEHH